MLAAIAALPAAAQSVELTLPENGALSTGVIQLFALVTVLSLVPGIAVTVTCFPFIVTVLSILRQALGLQQSPPNMLIVSLALFLSYYVMEPVFLASWEQGIAPYSDGALSLQDAFPNIAEPFRIFMGARVDADTLGQLYILRENTPPEFTQASEAPLSVLVPSFMLSEIERAFQIGFLIFLPFLIIDLVVSAILMSMGMMMVPPVIVSLPFKLAFFVVADGWALLSSALVRGYMG